MRATTPAYRSRPDAAWPPGFPARASWPCPDATTSSSRPSRPSVSSWRRRGRFCRTERGARQRRREQSAAPPTMEIASDVALNQTGLKRRRRRLSARLVRLAVAAGLIGLVFTSPSEAIYLLALTSMPLMMLYGELSVLERSLLVLLYLAGISVLYVLIALMSSRKIPILYLRKFGLSRANRMVTRAIEGGLGRQYRVLTLDDSDFKPLEIPRIERILSRVAIPIALLL